MSDRTSVGKSAFDLRTSPEFDAYSKVIIHIGEDENGNDVVYQAGKGSGRTLEITNPWGTQAMANTLLASLQRRGLLYQPYTAQSALVDPSAELGDGVSVSDVYSGIYTQDTTFGSLMASNISAPSDEEVDHEFPYVSKEQREYKRETAKLVSRISITETQIQSEVSRASAAEGNLSSRITQNATAITAKVSASGGNSSSFGWELTSSLWRLFSGGATVLTADRNGLSVNGTINSKAGNIGGFAIGNSAIYNNISNFGGSQSTGVYLGTNGIQLGQGFKVNSSGAVTASNLTITGGSIKLGSNFSVNSSGNVTANNMTLTGMLTIGGETITAAALRSGAQSAYNNAPYWSGGAAGGYSFSNATNRNSGVFPDYFRSKILVASTSLIASSGFTMGDHTISKKSIIVKDSNGNNKLIYYLAWL